MQDPLFSQSLLLTLPTLGTVFTSSLEDLFHHDTKPSAFELKKSLLNTTSPSCKAELLATIIESSWQAILPHTAE